MNNEIKELIEELKDSYGIAMPKQEYFGYIKGIENYITNLQQENQELNDSVVWWNDRFNAVQRDYEDYKSRIEKAVEYIKQYGNLYCLKHQQFKKYYQYEELLNILNGKSDE